MVGLAGRPAYRPGRGPADRAGVTGADRGESRLVAASVIFDCDGVLVDSDRISLPIQAEWMTALGVETSYEDCVRDFLGLGMPATLRILGERLGRPAGFIRPTKSPAASRPPTSSSAPSHRWTRHRSDASWSRTARSA